MSFNGCAKGNFRFYYEYNTIECRTGNLLLMTRVIVYRVIQSRSKCLHLKVFISSHIQRTCFFWRPSNGHVLILAPQQRPRAYFGAPATATCCFVYLAMHVLFCVSSSGYRNVNHPVYRVTINHSIDAHIIVLYCYYYLAILLKNNCFQAL